MKAILLNGSPRENGCTHRALEEVCKTLGEEGIDCEIVHAEFSEAKVQEVAEKILASDALVIGSPVYYASASGLCTWFCDELFNRIGNKVRLKVGAAVVSARRGGESATFDQINKYFTISEMVVAGSNYWNQVHGNTPDEVEKDEEGLQTMRILGRNIAFIVKSISKAGLQLPETEKRIKTNFVR